MHYKGRNATLFSLKYDFARLKSYDNIMYQVIEQIHKHEQFSTCFYKKNLLKKLRYTQKN